MVSRADEYRVGTYHWLSDTLFLQVYVVSRIEMGRQCIRYHHRLAGHLWETGGSWRMLSTLKTQLKSSLGVGSL